MAERAALERAAETLDGIGQLLVVVGWVGLFGLALVAGVAYLRWRS